ncbi:MAG: HlyD family efflux transporter periplasmic adaptor subunit [Eubacteriales bacterium SKADARSKE-1]|nr:HlyD family efflux transporter periplasmic adaptor subunit [Eubacteriales bacterium SKADARSKE-1]
MAEKNKLFREEALETVSNPEQLDQHVRITRPSVWVIIFAIVGLVIGVGVWAFTGNISSGAQIAGVIFPTDSVIISSAKNTGTVMDVLVDENEVVAKGDILAVVPDETLLAQIALKQDEYNKASGAQKTSIGATLDALKYQYIDNSFVVADKDGTINGITAINTKVNIGDQLAVNVADKTTANSKEILAYVPFSTAMNLKVGMEAQVSPTQAPREEYGYMVGTITRIGTSTVTQDTIIRSMGTTKYINALGLTEDSVEVRVRLNVDTSTASGFEWSNSKGGTVQVDIGNICNIKVVTDTKRPIDLLI